MTCRYICRGLFTHKFSEESRSGATLKITWQSPMIHVQSCWSGPGPWNAYLYHIRATYQTGQRLKSGLIDNERCQARDLRIGRCSCSVGV
jgi:hypothetical protein